MIGIAQSNREIMLCIPYLDIKAFKELINRGANCWDQAPPSIKQFLDSLDRSVETIPPKAME